MNGAAMLNGPVTGLLLHRLWHCPFFNEVAPPGVHDLIIYKSKEQTCCNLCGV